MAKKFYPGCKIKAAYPEESERLRKYLQQREDVEVMGCCRANWEGHGTGDEGIYICNNCHEILSESAGFGILSSVWGLIDADADFPFPDYGGEQIALADCWIAGGNHEVHDAVRSLLAKMNICVIEPEQSRDESRFCGTNILVEASASNARLAPVRWGEKKDAEVALVPEEEWPAYFNGACEQFATEKVACYCKFCADGLRLGGKQPVHLLELLFPAGE